MPNTDDKILEEISKYCGPDVARLFGDEETEWHAVLKMQDKLYNYIDTTNYMMACNRIAGSIVKCSAMQHAQAFVETRKKK